METNESLGCGGPQKVLLVRFGEVHLKGLNRPYFLNELVRQIRRAARGLAETVTLVDSRVYVENISDFEACTRRVRKVFGVFSVSPALRLDKRDFPALCAAAVELMRGKTGSFKVVARRSDKAYPMDSPQINKEIGGYVLRQLPALSVDVHHPAHELGVEIREMAYLYVERLPAVGGMPLGTGGKATLLLSGGIDSPVAGFMVAKRGVTLSCVHYHSFPYTSERAKEKVVELARILSESCGPLPVSVVPFTEIQTQIHEKCPDNYTTLLMRRYMMRIAQEIARQEGAQALVTGESIGQVASQTMQALSCTDEVADMPVFRPLIGFDKIEIVERAQAIGTLETSQLPYEDCCTIFTPKHPATRPKRDILYAAEEKLDGDALMQAALAGVERIFVES